MSLFDVLRRDLPLLAKLKACDKLMSEGPWIEDDGHVHSEPTGDEFEEWLRRNMAGEDVGPDPRDEQPTEVAHCSQDLPNFDNDAHGIAFLRTVLPGIIQAMEERQ